MEKRRIKHFTMINRITELPVLVRKTEKLAQDWELPVSLILNISLVLEEALANIIYYAFSDNREHKIRISLSQSNNKLTVRIKDDGIPFDPSAQLQPDITLPAVERPVGGLGIFLISKIMDTVHYSREKNLNILTLIKKI
jgi:anti-sigma regulatory factor (Ser/Thr protein kinase)